MSFICIGLISITAKFCVELEKNTVARYNFIKPGLHNANSRTLMVTNVNILQQIVQVPCHVRELFFLHLQVSVCKFVAANTHHFRTPFLWGRLYRDPPFLQ
jgi:hypothetical protein